MEEDGRAAIDPSPTLTDRLLFCFLHDGFRSDLLHRSTVPVWMFPKRRFSMGLFPRNGSSRQFKILRG